jgi:hypothetical protein
MNSSFAGQNMTRSPQQAPANRKNRYLCGDKISFSLLFIFYATNMPTFSVTTVKSGATTEICVDINGDTDHPNEDDDDYLQLMTTYTPKPLSERLVGKITVSRNPDISSEIRPWSITSEDADILSVLWDKQTYYDQLRAAVFAAGLLARHIYTGSGSGNGKDLLPVNVVATSYTGLHVTLPSMTLFQAARLSHEADREGCIRAYLERRSALSQE